MYKCLNFKKLDNDTVQCEACAHFCVVKEGEVGICGVRQNVGGEFYLLVYGLATAVHIDPIEKKPLFHFLPGSQVFSFGTLGCNFRCANCQNYQISQIYNLKGDVNRYDEIDLGYNFSPEKIVKNAVESGCHSIAYTYNEPTVFLEYALETMKLAHEKGLKNIWVSNGFMSNKTLDCIEPYLDAANIDIKSFSMDFYKKNCGARLAPVLENCQRLVKEGVWLEITTLIIPTLSDEEKMFRQVAKFIKEKLGDDVPWHISAFSGEISWQLQSTPATPIGLIKRAYEVGKEEGLKYVYAGNTWKSNLESSYCGRCGEILIKRIGYEAQRFDRGGICAHCGEKMSGIFV